MAMIDNPYFRRLRVEQQRVVIATDALAWGVGGATPDVLRTGKRKIRPGFSVLATVTDLDAQLQGEHDPDNLLFGLEIVNVAGFTWESITVALGDGYVTQTLDDQSLTVYRDQSAPPYAIKSFFDRYPIEELVESLDR